jgi:hypothetical protein
VEAQQPKLHRTADPVDGGTTDSRKDGVRSHQKHVVGDGVPQGKVAQHADEQVERECGAEPGRCRWPPADCGILSVTVKAPSVAANMPLWPFNNLLWCCLRLAQQPC